MTTKQMETIRRALEADKIAHVSFGNVKIGRMMNFSLMALWTCSKQACETCGKGGCYARREVRYPSVLFNRVQNTWLAQNNQPLLFVELCKVIDRKKPAIIRLHESGDFVNVAYLDMWLQIARKYPQITVYTYTKQFDIIRERASEILALPNVEIKLSAWPGLELPADLIAMGFGVAYIDTCEDVPDDAVQCPNQIDKYITCEQCQLCAKPGNVKFKKH